MHISKQAEEQVQNAIVSLKVRDHREWCMLSMLPLLSTALWQYLFFIHSKPGCELLLGPLKALLDRTDILGLIEATLLAWTQHKTLKV